MKVSIITVCYNSESTIRNTIESVLSQTYSNIEYIIVDAKSKDSTLSIINEYKEQIDLIISEPDKGIYDAMNKGINASTGDIVGILNSDDYYENTRVISKVAECFLATPSIDIAFGDVIFVNPRDLTKVIRLYNSEHFRPWKLRFGWMPPHPATFIRKRCYDCSGPYSIDYKISADFEMFVRLFLVHRFSYARIDKVIVRMRSGGVSTAGIASSIRLNTEIVRACKNNGYYTNLVLVLLKLPFKLFELIKKPA